MSAEFCDTNVIFYVHDTSAGTKRAVASELVERLWASRQGVVSIQVLQETFVTLTKKGSPPLSVQEARSVIGDLVRWQVVEPDRQDVLRAVDTSVRWQISFWDAMLLVAARKAGAGVLWSEDLKNGQDYDGVVVRNPFVPGAS